jgi:hypothetical protein
LKRIRPNSFAFNFSQSIKCYHLALSIDERDQGKKGGTMRPILAAGTAIALAVPFAANADELSDLKEQLQTAVKSIQVLQERVRH